MTDYEQIEFNGQPARRYADGTIRNAEGRYLQRPLHAAPIITSDIAPSLAQRRHEKYQEAAQAGMVAAANSTSPRQLDHPAEAWGFIIEKQTELATSPEAGHASTQAAKLVGRSVGAIQERGSVNVEKANVLVVDPDTARLLAADGLLRAAE